MKRKSKRKNRKIIYIILINLLFNIIILNLVNNNKITEKTRGFLQTVGYAPPKDIISISNSKMQIDFDSANGYAIKQITNLETGRAFLTSASDNPLY
jgi:hypothetical protein